MNSKSWTIADAGKDYADFDGGAWANIHVLIRHPSLYESVGLDPQRWSIVGIELSASNGVEDRLTLTAFDHSQAPVDIAKNLVQLAQETGALPVVEFRLTGATVNELASRVFSEFHVQLRARHLGDVETRVIDRRDLGPTGP